MCNDFINSNYKPNTTHGSYWIYPKLIENKIKVLIMSGDTDASVSSLGTINWI